ncbi:hypothetical protein HRF87_05070 [Bacillus sp. CRN 9]|nr:hypothetical protein [Bacillus sp. CRN 9]
MEINKMKDLLCFVLQKTKISIRDEAGDEQAPFISKIITKVDLCPDSTHIRIYFDQIHFLAVPLTSNITTGDNWWTAFDENSGLQYVLRKEAESYD